MNTNSNTYTVIYTTLVCVLVAAILAFVSQVLKPKQEANEKAETISQILTAAGFDEKAHWQEIGNAATIAFYQENLADAFVVNAQGETTGTLDKDKAVSKQYGAIVGPGHMVSGFTNREFFLVGKDAEILFTYRLLNPYPFVLMHI